ncbi:MAG: LysR family transcriptional regulator [Chloroflexi bacterium]|nr:LysR family transcriptional regulator [Chloroflexota bacterium]
MDDPSDHDLADSQPASTSGGELPGARLAALDLNLLLSLQALVHYRSVTLAGAHIGLSQPAMSSTLRRLRELFDDPLLIRVGREYQLTALAQELVEPLDRVLADAEQILVRRRHFEPQSSRRTFSIELSDYAMLLLVKPLLETLAEHAPGLTLHLHPREPPSSTRVRDGVIDLLLAPNHPIEGLHMQPLFSDRWVCAVASENRVVGDRLTPEVFVSLRHIGVGFGNPPRSSDPEQAYRALGVHPRVPVTTESFVLAPFIVSGTQLATLVPERLGRRFEVSAGIRLLELPFNLPDVTESMFWGPAADSDPAHAWLRQTIASLALSV